jgi:hypothetical protein
LREWVRSLRIVADPVGRGARCGAVRTSAIAVMLYIHIYSNQRVVEIEGGAYARHILQLPVRVGVVQQDRCPAS